MNNARYNSRVDYQFSRTVGREGRLHWAVNCTPALMIARHPNGAHICSLVRRYLSKQDNNTVINWLQLSEFFNTKLIDFLRDTAAYDFCFRLPTSKCFAFFGRLKCFNPLYQRHSSENITKSKQEPHKLEKRRMWAGFSTEKYRKKAHFSNWSHISILWEINCSVGRQKLSSLVSRCSRISSWK